METIFCPNCSHEHDKESEAIFVCDSCTCEICENCSDLGRCEDCASEDE